MLQVKDLSIYHRKDLRPLVEGLSFVLHEGDKMALIGEEGNGKSTLLKLLYDASLVEDYVEYTGEIGKNHCVCGYLAQEPAQGDRLKTIYEYLSEEEAFLEADYEELAVWAGELGIPMELLYGDARMGMLSGGERVKVQLMRLLSRRPDVFLLDEPSNDIDIATLEWLENFIRNCPFGVLYISHDETLLERTANKILHMEQLQRKSRPKCTVVQAGYREYVDMRSASLERQERLATEEKAAYRKQQEKFRKIHDKVEQMTRMPETEEAIFFRFAEGEGIPAGKWVLDLYLKSLYVGKREEEGAVRKGNQGKADLKAGIAGTGSEDNPEGLRQLAGEIRLQVRGPEKICIIGKNGAGKTTLLRLIAEELLERQDIQVAYMPQNYEELLDWNLSPVDFLVDYLKWEGSRGETTRIRTYLGSMKYTADEMDHPIRELSGGQKAKLLLLGMSMDHRNVLVLDEPTRNFSPLSGPVVRRLFTDFPGAIISVSHDRKYIAEVCDSVYELDGEGLHRITDP